MNASKWSKMSLTEKIRWRNKHPIKNSWLFADKILAKDIALQRAPECKVNKIIYVSNKPEDIDIAKLPKDYIFKANHGSGWLLKIRDGLNVRTGEKVTNEILRDYAKKWTGQMYRHGTERQYSLIEPRVFFEEYLEDFMEFRLFCFNGKVKFFMIDVSDSDGTRTTIYDTGWNRIHAHWLDPEGTEISEPNNFSKIINITEKLATDIDFIRIDIFLKGKDVYFGEFTFTPNAGRSTIKPAKFDMIWGAYWTHDMSNKAKLQVPQGFKEVSFSSKINAERKITTYRLTNKIKRLFSIGKK
jgi:hypothetical protein